MKHYSRHMIILVALSVALNVLLQGSLAVAQDRQDLTFTEVLMESTFLIESSKSRATCFILVEPLPDDPSRGRYILVTAEHVLSGLQSDAASIRFRSYDGNDWSSNRTTVQVKKSGEPLWVRHPKEDIAVMHMNVPDGAIRVPISTTWLVTDDRLREIGIHPSDEMRVIGFPFGLALAADFPVLRRGWIASYPILPSSRTRGFLLTFDVFQGNSGGPVFFETSMLSRGGNVTVGNVQFIAGLVSKQLTVDETVTGINVQEVRKHQLALAQIVPAPFIRETIDLLYAREASRD